MTPPLNPATIKTVSDLRVDPVAVFDAATKLGEPIYVFHRSKPKGVIMDLAKYRQLVELIEDYHDALTIKHTLADKKAKWVTWETFKRKHQLAP